MEVSEFIEETSKIEKFYEKDLDKFQRDIWFQELKKISINRYKHIVRQVFNECKFMPKLADIVSINQNLTYKAEENEHKQVDCNICGGLGLVPYKKIINNGPNKLEYQYFALCICENRLNYIYDGKKITDKENKSKYYIPTMQEIEIN